MPDHDFIADIKTQAPDAYRALAALTRSATGLDPELSELVKIRASAVNRCEYCLELHVRAARRLGVDEAVITAAERSHLHGVDDRTAAALNLTTALTDSAHLRNPRLIAGATPMARAMRHFAEPELSGLVMTIVAINAWNRTMIAQGLTREDVAD